MYEDRSGLQVATALAKLVELEIAPGTGVHPAAFWSGYAAILAELAPLNRRLLARRDEIQHQIDAWHAERRGE